MIGKLTGTIDTIQGNQIILDVGGVGYVVACGARTLASLGGVGEPASLYIETIVREDAITLYGFADALEQHWFKTLTTVQGVGAKVGISILSALTPEQLQLAIGARDHTILTRADGIGPKLGQRIVMELKDKTMPAALNIGSGTTTPATAKKSGATPPGSNDNTAEDAISALLNLGYARAEAYQAVNSVISTGETNLSAIISKSLKELAA